MGSKERNAGLRPGSLGRLWGKDDLVQVLLVFLFYLVFRTFVNLSLCPATV